MAIGDKYLSRTEARRELRLSKDQMIYRIRKGDIKAEKAGYNYLISTKEVERVRTTDWYKGTVLQPEGAA